VSNRERKHEFQIFVLLIFLLAYLLFVLLPSRRSIVAMAGALAIIVSRAISMTDASGRQWNVMGIFVGTLVWPTTFMESGCGPILPRSSSTRRKTPAGPFYSSLMDQIHRAFVENDHGLIVAPARLRCQKNLTSTHE
jgi:cbb3-type cytochrome oxidase subunit 3